MREDLDGLIGEGWAGEAATGIHVNLVIGRRGGAVAAAATSALGNPTPGHVPFLVCAGPGKLIRPATVLVNKTPVNDDALASLTWGAVQLGVADAVLDGLATGRISTSTIDDIVLLVVVWVDPSAASHCGDAGFETDLRSSTNAAACDALADALVPTPPISMTALAARRGTFRNGFYRGR
jgi:5,6,7,8-tetrahydromethanopterin hydro-lyase